MTISIEVKSSQVQARTSRERTAKRVLAEFHSGLPERLLCFLDDQNWPTFKKVIGPANRGFYAPVKEDEFWTIWPEYLKDCVLVEDPSSRLLKRAFDHVIYLHGGTCEHEIGLSMTLAHELQHAVQHTTSPTLWAVNTLVQYFPKHVIRKLNLKWFDIPIERECRIVSKRVAEKLFGPDATRQFVEWNIINAVDAQDSDDWRFIRQLDTSAPYDLAEKSRLIFQLTEFRLELEKLLEEFRDDPDFNSLNLNEVLVS
jgi:hypothetical protein